MVCSFHTPLSSTSPSLACHRPTPLRTGPFLKELIPPRKYAPRILPRPELSPLHPPLDRIKKIQFKSSHLVKSFGHPNGIGSVYSGSISIRSSGTIAHVPHHLSQFPLFGELLVEQRKVLDQVTAGLDDGRAGGNGAVGLDAEDEFPAGIGC